MYRIRNFTGNQCNSLSSGVTCSRLNFRMTVAKVAVLYRTRNFTGNQCNSLSSGVTCSRLNFHMTSLAAQFWIFCKRVICSAGRSWRMDLQQSSHEVIMEETSLTVGLRDRLECIHAVFSSSRKVARETLLHRPWTCLWHRQCLHDQDELYRRLEMLKWNSSREIYSTIRRHTKNN